MTRTIRLASLAGLTLVAAGCGGTSSTPTIGSQAGGGVKRGPVMVFVGLGDESMFEAACHDCDALRAAMDGQLVASGGASFRINGEVSDECGASGPTQVIAVKRVSGNPDTTPLGVAVLPADAAIDLRHHPVEVIKDLTADPALMAALARRANADRAAGSEPITPELIALEQVLRVNVAGDGRDELLVAANVPKDDSDGPGYQWSALVMAPGGDLDAAVTLWQSDLEHLWIDASFDLEGDGLRELLFSAEYYEGGGRGAAVVKEGALHLLGTWGCGA